MICLSFVSPHLTFVVISELRSFTISTGASGTCCSCLAHGIRDWTWHMLSYLWLFGRSNILSAALLSLQRSCWLEPATLKRPLPALAKHEQMFSLFFLPSHSFPLFKCRMIHPKGNIHTRCRFLLREWRFIVFHPRLDRAQLTPRNSPDNTFYLSVFPMGLLQPPLIFSNTRLSASTHFSAPPFKQSSALNHLYSELYLDTFLSCWSQSPPLARFPQDCSKFK